MEEEELQKSIDRLNGSREDFNKEIARIKERIDRVMAEINREMQITRGLIEKINKIINVK